MLVVKIFGGAAAAHGILPGAPVRLFILHDGHASQAGSPSVSAAGAPFETEAVRSLQTHDLKPEQDMDLVVIHNVFIAVSIKNLQCPHQFHTKDEVPVTYGGMLSTRLYA